MNNSNNVSPDTIMKENVHNESSINEDSVLLRDTTVTAKQRDMDDTSKPYRNQSQHQKQNPMQPPSFQSRCQSYPLAIAKVDDDLLHRAIADAGRWAFGTICECFFIICTYVSLFRVTIMKSSPPKNTSFTSISSDCCTSRNFITTFIQQCKTRCRAMGLE